MSIIDWNEEVTPDLDDKVGREIFLTLLKRPIDKKWQGQIHRKRKSDVNFHAPYLELRKHMGDAQVLIRIGYRAPSRHWPSQTVPDHLVSQLSMNAKADFVQDDYVELNLVTAEAFAVYEAVEKEIQEALFDI